MYILSNHLVKSLQYCINIVIVTVSKNLTLKMMLIRNKRLVYILFTCELVNRMWVHWQQNRTKTLWTMWTLPTQVGYQVLSNRCVHFLLVLLELCRALPKTWGDPRTYHGSAHTATSVKGTALHHDEAWSVGAVWFLWSPPRADLFSGAAPWQLHWLRQKQLFQPAM